MKRSDLYAILLSFLLTALFFCQPLRVQGQVFQFDNAAKSGSLKFITIKNLIIIPVYINDRGPYNFILDSGVDPMIIIDTTLVDRSQLEVLRQVRITGIGNGEEVLADYTTSLKATVKNASIQGIPTVLLKEDLLNLSTFVGMKIHGLIGYYFFNSFIVKINFIDHKMGFQTPSKRKKWNWASEKLEVIQHKPYIRTTLLTESLGNIEAQLIVDLGGNHSLSLEQYKESPFPLPAIRFPANLGVGLNGKISGHIARISGMKLGEYRFDNIVANYPDYEDVAAKSKVKGRTGSLGAGILNRFDLIFDYPGEKMYFRKNEHFKRPFEHDMSGLELYVDEKYFNRVFVSRIEKESPAEKAGIQVNDEIISINFSPIENYNIDKIGNLLKGENGRTVVIEFVRGTQHMIKLLRLVRKI